MHATCLLDSLETRVVGRRCSHVLKCKPSSNHILAVQPHPSTSMHSLKNLKPISVGHYKFQKHASKGGGLEEAYTWRRRFVSEHGLKNMGVATLNMIFNV